MAERAAYGLLLEGSYRVRFPNFIRIELIWRIIRFFGNNDGLARLAYLPFLFALRVPSEALVIRRAHKGGAMTLFAPQRDKDLVSRMDIDGSTALALKLAWRIHMTGGCISQRPFFSPNNTDWARARCPIHGFGHGYGAHHRSGELLRRAINVRSVNRFIRRAFAISGVPATDRYRSHGFRRVGAQELKESGAHCRDCWAVGRDLFSQLRRSFGGGAPMTWRNGLSAHTILCRATDAMRPRR